MWVLMVQKSGRRIGVPSGPVRYPSGWVILREMTGKLITVSHMIFSLATQYAPVHTLARPHTRKSREMLTAIILIIYLRGTHNWYTHLHVPALIRLRLTLARRTHTHTTHTFPHTHHTYVPHIYLTGTHTGADTCTSRHSLTHILTLARSPYAHTHT
jgi:hypothetical protein